jgi:hypothetical protein
MDGRSVVNDNPEAVAALLTVLRAHDVAKYERDASGAIRIEFYAPAPTKPPPLFTSPIVDPEEERRLCAPEDNDRTRQDLPPKEKPPLGIASLPATDPLFDGLGDGT